MSWMKNPGSMFGIIWIGSSHLILILVGWVSLRNPTKSNLNDFANLKLRRLSQSPIL